MTIRLLVLDVMKPHKPSVIEYATALQDLDSVQGVNIIMLEIDKEVENIELHINGDDLDFEQIKTEIRNLAGAIHSIDQVVAGKVTDQTLTNASTE